tara:strand:+ start:655 stop:885 length:231 start_codon:yes stop_codon:yes gene_type:complete
MKQMNKIYRWLYGKIFRKFHKGNRVVWSTHPLCPYQGKEGTITKKLHMYQSLTMAHIQWDDGTENDQPIGFLKRIP